MQRCGQRVGLGFRRSVQVCVPAQEFVGVRLQQAPTQVTDLMLEDNDARVVKENQRAEKRIHTVAPPTRIQKASG